MIKSMLARLEIYNSLAPIQDYGRHQTKNSRIPKKKGPEPTAATAQDIEGSTSGQPDGKGGKDFNEQFYDLDDDFIDDGELAS